MLWIVLGVNLLVLVPLLIWTVRRTTDRVRSRAHQAQSQERLAELGMLTGGLAHEIKNPLSSVGLNLQLVQEDLRELTAGQMDASAAGEKLQRIQRRMNSLERETHRLKDILEDFLHFAGRMKLDVMPVDVHGLIDDLVDFFTPQAQQAKVRLRTQLSAESGRISADGGLLKQAILNLLINATQAMAEARESGKAHGGADELLLRTHQVRVHGREYLVIHVIDTGPGISAEHLGKVFQPYFSTKKGGSGLGLPTTRRIIEEHTGSIRVHSEVGRGTDIMIQLPVEGPPGKVTK